METDISRIVPATRPEMTRDDVGKYLQEDELTQYRVRLLGVRGYYKKTMGDPTKNDRGLYDDALFLVTPAVFKSFNFNTDPSFYRKGIAVLKPGIYWYKIGLHGVSRPHPYEALRQWSRVTVVRDGEGEETDTADAPFYTDIHKGGYHTTSSLGCETIYPEQWEEFLDLIKKELNAYNQVLIPYKLVEL